MIAGVIVNVCWCAYMREWFLSSELSGLDGMPTSNTGVSQKGRRNKWLSRKSLGSSRILEYHISNFHPDIKKQLIARHISDPQEAEQLLRLTEPTEEIAKETSNISRVMPMTEVKEWCELPVFDVHAAAGAGSLVHSEYQVDRLILPTSLLAEFSLSPTTASIIYVNGDSMEPTLSDGDRLLVDIREQQHPVVNGVYVIRIDDAVYVKRLHWDIPKGTYDVISDNASIQAPFEIDKNSGRNFKIIGKAIAPVFKKIF